MSVFDDIMLTQCAPAMIELHGQAITYQAPGQQVISLSAVVGDEEEELSGEGTGGTLEIVKRRTFIVNTDTSVPWGGIAAPLRNALITYEGGQWAIENVERLAGSTASLKTRRVALAQWASDGYRGNP